MELLTQIINGKNYVLIEWQELSMMDYDKFNKELDRLDIIIQANSSGSNKYIYKLLIPENNIKEFKSIDFSYVYTEEQEKAKARLGLMLLIPAVLFAIFWFCLTNFIH